MRSPHLDSSVGLPNIDTAELARTAERLRASANGNLDIRSVAAGSLGLAARWIERARSLFSDSVETVRRETVVAQRAVLEAGDAFDPRGWFVYSLWDEEQECIYVGMSSNVLARLGTHLQSQDRRHLVAQVRLLRCSNSAEARKVEASLIAEYQPTLNIHGVL